MTITGAGSYKSTAALGITGAVPKMWNRGITCGSDSIAQETIADYCNPKISISIAGQPTYGVKQVHEKTKNLFQGNTGIGYKPTDIFSLSVGKGLGLTGGIWLKAFDKQDVDHIGALYENKKFPSSILNELKPVFSKNVNGSIDYGFDLASVKNVNPALIRQASQNDESEKNTVKSKSKYVETDDFVSLEGIIALLVESVKDQAITIEELSDRIQSLKNKNRVRR